MKQIVSVDPFKHVKEIDNNGKRLISKSRFAIQRRNTHDDVRCIFHEACQGKSNSEIEHLLNILNNEKREVARVGRKMWRTIILKKAIHCNLKRYDKPEMVVSSLKHIRELWTNAHVPSDGKSAEECLQDTYEVLYTCCYADTDQDPFFVDKMEAKLLERFNLGYLSNSKTSKGCFHRLLSDVRTQIMFSLNRGAKKSHGQQIRSKRTAKELAEERAKEKKNKRRVKGPRTVVVDLTGIDCNDSIDGKDTESVLSSNSSSLSGKDRSNSRVETVSTVWKMSTWTQEDKTEVRCFEKF